MNSVSPCRFAVLFSSIAAAAGVAAPPIAHVRQGGTGDGSSWAQADGNLQKAIENIASAGGGQVWVAEGTYVPDDFPNGGAAAREVHFSLRNKVAVFGGFPPVGDPDMNDRNPGRHATVCSGNIGTPGSADNAYHVFFHPAAAALDATAVLNGVTIADGNASAPLGAGRLGGGMLNDVCSPALVRCVVEKNASVDEGGGIYNTKSEALFSHCVFAANYSPRGGALCNRRSPVKLFNCVFQENSATSGGALYNYDQSSVELRSSTFFGNYADPLSGGGMVNDDHCTPVIANTILWKDKGGEILDINSSASTLNFCIIDGGWAGAGSGNLNTDPLFVDSGNAPGPDAAWGTTDDGLRLDGHSPARDTGKDGEVPPDAGDVDEDGDALEALPVDLRGLQRFEANVDRGAYEFQTPTVTFVPGSHGTRTGGGALVQVLNEGGSATAPTLAVDLGWTFTGWSGAFTNVYVDTTVTAQYVPTFPAGGICHVKVGGTGNGTSWAQAAGDVQKAINAIAMAGGQVWIAAGTYHPNSWPNGGSTAREVHFSLRNGVAVYGGFPPTGSPGFAERNPPAQVTRLSADIGTPSTTADNAYNIFYHPAALALSTSARVDGFHLSDCAGLVSGAMYNAGSSPTVVRCVFENNTAFQGGRFFCKHRVQWSLIAFLWETPDPTTARSYASTLKQRSSIASSMLTAARWEPSAPSALAGIHS